MGFNADIQHSLRVSHSLRSAWLHIQYWPQLYKLFPIIPNFSPIPIPNWVQNAQFPSKFHLSCLGQMSSHELIRGQNHITYRHGNSRDSPVCWGQVPVKGESLWLRGIFTVIKSDQYYCNNTGQKEYYLKSLRGVQWRASVCLAGVFDGNIGRVGRGEYYEKLGFDKVEWKTSGKDTSNITDSYLRGWGREGMYIGQ